MLQQVLYHISELYSVLYLFFDDWLSLLLSALFGAVLFFSWDFGIVYQQQKAWLNKHKDLIAQYHILQAHLNEFGQQVSCCKNCNKRDMQLWDFQKHLLVIRCSACKMNYTFAQGKNPLLFKVLLEMERVMILFNMIIVYRYHPFGRLLASRLKVDIALLSTATTPLEIIHFTAQGEYMSLGDLKNLEIFEYEVVLPEDALPIAV